MYCVLMMSGAEVYGQCHCCNISAWRNELPAILFDHVSHFNYKFTFFVLLAGFKSMFLEQCAKVPSKKYKVNQILTYFHPSVVLQELQ